MSEHMIKARYADGRVNFQYEVLKYCEFNGQELRVAMFRKSIHAAMFGTLLSKSLKLPFINEIPLDEAIERDAENVG
jgi:hypothetical protein